MASKKQIIIFVVFLLIISLGIIYLSNISPFNISLDKDSIYMNVQDRSYTYIEIIDEVLPYDSVWLNINTIAPESETIYGPDISGNAPYYLCPSIPKDPVSGYSSAQRQQCCNMLGYQDWSIVNSRCFKNIEQPPGEVDIFVAGHNVYTWDGNGDYPQNDISIDFAEVVNNYCGLNDPLYYCSDSDYKVDNADEPTVCLYYQPTELNGAECINNEAVYISDYGEDYILCQMTLEARNLPRLCEVPLTVETGTGYGYLNLGISFSGRGQTGVIDIVQPPIYDPIEEELDYDPEDPQTEQSEEQSSIVNFLNTYKIVFIVILLLLLVLGVVYFVKGK